MKKSIFAFLQFLLFLGIYAASPVLALFDPMHPHWFVSHPTATATRYFVPEGLLLMFVLFVIVALFTAFRRNRQTLLLSSAAFAAAFFLGALARFGWATHDLF